jgi:DNA-binding MarR family transcriptional regulator
MAKTSITTELQQKTPFPTHEQETVVALLKTADSVYRAVTKVTSVEGLSLEQYNVLRILRGAGTEGIATLEISKRMIHHDPGMTRLLDKLEKKGMVIRKRCPTDRRKVMCWVTEAGRNCLSSLDTSLGPVLQKTLRGFTRNSHRELLNLLTAIRDNE